MGTGYDGLQVTGYGLQILRPCNPSPVTRNP